MKKNILIILGVLFVVGMNNYIWFGKYISLSLELESLSSELYAVQTSFDELKSISLDISPNTSKKDLIDLLKQKTDSSDIFEKNGNIYSPNLGFVFNSSRLREIIQDVEFNENSPG